MVRYRTAHFTLNSENIGPFTFAHLEPDWVRLIFKWNPDWHSRLLVPQHQEKLRYGRLG